MIAFAEASVRLSAVMVVEAVAGRERRESYL